MTEQTEQQFRLTITSRLIKTDIKGGLRLSGEARRDRLEIINEILHCCKKDKTKTAIMYSTNLNCVQLRSYMSKLLFLKMLTQNGRMYVTTEKGRRFLELFAGLSEILAEPRSLERHLPSVPRVS